MIEEKTRLIYLYDFYKSLLTDKQCGYFESYYFYDESLNEIALNMSVSKNAVHDNLKRTINLINDYEDKLSLYKQYIKRKKVIEKIREISTNDKVLCIINDLEEEE